MLSLLVSCTSGALTLLGHVGLLTKLLQPCRAWGLMCAANAVATADAIRVGLTLSACLHAVACAIFAWLWWNSGGRDGTRRCWRQLTRRTAPTTT